MSALLMVAEIVNWSDLGQTVAASLIAGIGITAAFAVGILGAAQWAERRRRGEAVAAAGAATLSVLGLAVCAAGIVFGLIVMLGD